MSKKTENTKIITNHYNRFTKEREKHPCIKDIVILNDDIYNWYVIIHKIESEDNLLDGAEFIFQFHMPDDVIKGPPAVKYLTDTGIFETGHNICMSISSYHAYNYSAAIGLAGFAELVISILPFYKDLAGGVAVIYNPSKSDIRKCARYSKYFNYLHNEKVLMNSIFKDQYIADKDMIMEDYKITYATFKYEEPTKIEKKLNEANNDNVDEVVVVKKPVKSRPKKLTPF